MERNTIRFVAIGVIGVIAVASVVGVLVVINLPESVTNPYEYPGLDSKPKLSRTIKIGLLDDLAVTGWHSSRGMELAAKEINEGGGVDVGGTTYYIGIVSEDTREAFYDYATAVSAALKMVSYDPDVVIGGFRTEVLDIYIDEIMDAHIPFIITGSATKAFTDNVAGFGYSYWKYLFRIMPHNNERLGNQVGRQLSEVIIPNITDYKLSGAPVDNVWIVYEDLAWTSAVKDAVVDTLNASYPHYLGLENLTLRAVPSNADDTYMGALWTDIAADTDCHLVVPIISDTTVGSYFGKHYGLKTPDALVCGINVAAQNSGYMTSTTDGGLYEITTAGSIRLNFTDTNIDFIDAYRAAYYGQDPLYTATGAYDAVNFIANRTNECGSLAASDLITSFEKVNITHWWPGVSQRIAFDANHDCMDDVGTAETDMFRANVYRQWQKNAAAGSGSVAGVCPLVPSCTIDTADFDNLRPVNETNFMLYPSWW